MNSLYLANPLGFSELGRIGLSLIQSILGKYFDVHEPFTNTPTDLINDLEKGEDTLNFNLLKKTNREIASLNMRAIEQCKYLLAIVDGSDVDSGTAWEIGYAVAKGKIVYLLDTDIRWRGDNLGDRINLQVKCAPDFTGGEYFTSIDQMDEYFSKL